LPSSLIAVMDIDSINAGTVDTKGWLNPTVGTLRAKKIICDDITPAPIPPEPTGVPNLGWVRTEAAPGQAVTINAGQFGYFWKDGTSSTPSGEVPLDQFGVGSVWEVFYSGIITQNSAGVAGLLFGLVLNPNIPFSIGSNIAGAVSYSSADTFPTKFEVRITVRVLGVPSGDMTNVAYSSTIQTLSVPPTSTDVPKSSSGGAIVNNVATFRNLTTNTVTLVPAVVAGVSGQSSNVTLNIAYARRIA
jgi:hypothetical protein